MNEVFIYVKYHKKKPVSFAARCDSLDRQFYAELTLPKKDPTIPGLPFGQADIVFPAPSVNMDTRFIIKDNLKSILEYFEKWKYNIPDPVFTLICTKNKDHDLQQIKFSTIDLDTKIYKVTPVEERTQENAIKFLRDYLNKE